MYKSNTAQFNKQNVSFRNVKKGNIQIFVKTILGNTISIDTNKYEDIKTLKQKIYKKTGIEIKNQRLIFAGKQLLEQKKISNYYINKHSTIHLSSRLLGGGSHGHGHGGGSPPNAHQTGNITPVGGTVRTGTNVAFFNNTNTDITVAVPVDNSNGLVGGLIQIAADVGQSGTYVDVGSTHTILASEKGTTVNITLTKANLTALSGWADGVDISFASSIDDTSTPANNLSTGLPSTTKLSVDLTNPTITISATDPSGAALTSGAQSGDAYINLKFTTSHATTDFTRGDIDLSGGTLGTTLTGSGTVYDISFSPTNAGNLTQIDVNAGKFTDAAGNQNDAATSFVWQHATAGGGGGHGGGHGPTTIDLSANTSKLVSGNIDVSENIATTTAVTTISDLNSLANSFKLSGADSSQFNIDPSSGVITFKASPDFENPTDAGGDNVYNLTVDGSNNTLTTVGSANGSPLSFTITVKNVNFDKNSLNLSPASNSTFGDAEITYTLNEDVSGVRVIWEETSTVGGPFVRHDPVELNSQYWVAGTHTVDSSANWTSNGNTTNAVWTLKLQVNKIGGGYPAVTHTTNHAVSTNLTYAFDISDSLINLRAKTASQLNGAGNVIIEDTTDISAGGLSDLVSKTTSQLKLHNNPDISGSFVDLSNVLLGGTPRLDASDCDVTVNDAISVPDFKKLDDVLDNDIILAGGIKVNATSDFVSGQDVFKQDLSNVFIQDSDVNVTIVNNISSVKYNRIVLNTTGSITTQGTGVGAKLNKANNKASTAGLGGAPGSAGATRLAKMKKTIPVKAGTTGTADKDDNDYKDALAAMKTEIAAGTASGATSKKQKRRAAVALLTSNNQTIKQFPMKKEDLGFNDKTKFKTDDIVVIVPGETVDIAAIRASTSNNSTGFIVLLDDGEETTLTVGTGKSVKIVREDSGANERYKIDTLTGITHSDFKKITGCANLNLTSTANLINSTISYLVDDDLFSVNGIELIIGSVGYGGPGADTIDSLANLGNTTVYPDASLNNATTVIVNDAAGSHLDGGDIFTLANRTTARVDISNAVHITGKVTDISRAIATDLSMNNAIDISINDVAATSVDVEDLFLIDDEVNDVEVLNRVKLFGKAQRILDANNANIKFGEADISINDLSNVTLAATDLKSIGDLTTHTATVIEADISGTISEINNAYNAGVFFTNSDISINDVQQIDAALVQDLVIIGGIFTQGDVSVESADLSGTVVEFKDIISKAATFTNSDISINDVAGTTLAAADLVLIDNNSNIVEVLHADISGSTADVKTLVTNNASGYSNSDVSLNDVAGTTVSASDLVAIDTAAKDVELLHADISGVLSDVKTLIANSVDISNADVSLNDAATVTLSASEINNVFINVQNVEVLHADISGSITDFGTLITNNVVFTNCDVSLNDTAGTTYAASVLNLINSKSATIEVLHADISGTTADVKTLVTNSAVLTNSDVSLNDTAGTTLAASDLVLIDTAAKNVEVLHADISGTTADVKTLVTNNASGYSNSDVSLNDVAGTTVSASDLVAIDTAAKDVELLHADISGVLSDVKTLIANSVDISNADVSLNDAATVTLSASEINNVFINVQDVEVLHADISGTTAEVKTLVTNNIVFTNSDISLNDAAGTTLAANDLALIDANSSLIEVLHADISGSTAVLKTLVTNNPAGFSNSDVSLNDVAGTRLDAADLVLIDTAAKVVEVLDADISGTSVEIKTLMANNAVLTNSDILLNDASNVVLKASELISIEASTKNVEVLEADISGTVAELVTIITQNININNSDISLNDVAGTDISTNHLKTILSATTQNVDVLEKVDISGVISDIITEVKNNRLKFPGKADISLNDASGTVVLASDLKSLAVATGATGIVDVLKNVNVKGTIDDLGTALSNGLEFAEVVDVSFTDLPSSQVNASSILHIINSTDISGKIIQPIDITGSVSDVISIITSNEFDISQSDVSLNDATNTQVNAIDLITIDNASKTVELLNNDVSILGTLSHLLTVNSGSYDITHCDISLNDASNSELAGADIKTLVDKIHSTNSVDVMNFVDISGLSTDFVSGVQNSKLVFTGANGADISLNDVAGTVIETDDLKDLAVATGAGKVEILNDVDISGLVADFDTAISNGLIIKNNVDVSFNDLAGASIHTDTLVTIVNQTNLDSEIVNRVKLIGTVDELVTIVGSGEMDITKTVVALDDVAKTKIKATDLKTIGVATKISDVSNACNIIGTIQEVFDASNVDVSFNTSLISVNDVDDTVVKATDLKILGDLTSNDVITLNNVDISGLKQDIEDAITSGLDLPNSVCDISINDANNVTLSASELSVIGDKIAPRVDISLNDIPGHEFVIKINDVSFVAIDISLNPGHVNATNNEFSVDPSGAQGGNFGSRLIQANNNLFLTINAHPNFTATYMPPATGPGFALGDNKFFVKHSDTSLTNVTKLTGNNCVFTSSTKIAQNLVQFANINGVDVTTSKFRGGLTDVVEADISGTVAEFLDANSKGVRFSASDISFNDANNVVVSASDLKTIADLTSGALELLSADISGTHTEVLDVSNANVKFEKSDISLNDTAGTNIAATDLKLIANETSGDIEVINQVDISGTVAEILDINNSNVTFTKADISLNDASGVDIKASDLATISQLTTATIDVINSIDVSGSLSDMVTAVTNGVIFSTLTDVSLNDPAGTVVDGDDLKTLVDENNLNIETINELKIEKGSLAAMLAITTSVSDINIVTSDVSLNDASNSLILASDLVTAGKEYDDVEVLFNVDISGTVKQILDASSEDVTFVKADISLNDAIGTVIDATDLKLIGDLTTGVVQLVKADISGTVAEVIAAKNSGVTFAVSDISLNDPSNTVVAATDLKTIGDLTSGDVELIGTSPAADISGTVQEVLDASNSGVTFVDSDISLNDVAGTSILATDLILIGNLTNYDVEIENKVTIQGTVQELLDVNNSGVIFENADVSLNNLAGTTVAASDLDTLSQLSDKKLEILSADISGTVKDVRDAQDNGVTFANSDISLNDAAGTDISATDLKLIGLGTSGDVEVLNQVDISGTVAEVIAAYNSGVTFDVADISLNDPLNTTISAEKIALIGGYTTGDVQTFNKLEIEGTVAHLHAALITANTLVDASNCQMKAFDAATIQDYSTLAPKTDFNIDLSGGIKDTSKNFFSDDAGTYTTDASGLITDQNEFDIEVTTPLNKNQALRLFTDMDMTKSDISYNLYDISSNTLILKNGGGDSTTAYNDANNIYIIPTITKIDISCNGFKPHIAPKGATIKLNIQFEDPIANPPDMIIDNCGNGTTMLPTVGPSDSWTATYVVDQFSNTGKVNWDISYNDNSPNPWYNIYNLDASDNYVINHPALSDNSGVTIDFKAPDISSLNIHSQDIIDASMVLFGVTTDATNAKPGDNVVFRFSSNRGFNFNNTGQGQAGQTPNMQFMILDSFAPPHTRTPINSQAVTYTSLSENEIEIRFQPNSNDPDGFIGYDLTFEDKFGNSASVTEQDLPLNGTVPIVRFDKTLGPPSNPGILTNFVATTNNTRNNKFAKAGDVISFNIETTERSYPNLFINGVLQPRNRWTNYAPAINYNNIDKWTLDYPVSLTDNSGSLLLELIIYDDANNKSQTFTQAHLTDNVNVAIQHQAPTLELNGPFNYQRGYYITIAPEDKVFNMASLKTWDPGAKAIDPIEGNVTNQIDKGFVFFSPGVYRIEYQAFNSSGLASQRFIRINELPRSSADPYIVPVLGNTYKLPDIKANYRLYQCGDIFINASVDKATSKMQSRMKDFFNKIGGDNKKREVITDGFYYHKFMINSEGHAITFDINKSEILVSEEDKLYFSLEIENKTEKNSLHSVGDYLEVIISWEHEEYGLQCISIDLYKNPQIDNGIKLLSPICEESIGLLVRNYKPTDFIIENIKSTNIISSKGLKYIMNPISVYEKNEIFDVFIKEKKPKTNKK